MSSWFNRSALPYSTSPLAKTALQYSSRPVSVFQTGSSITRWLRYTFSSIRSLPADGSMTSVGTNTSFPHTCYLVSIFRVCFFTCIVLGVIFESSSDALHFVRGYWIPNLSAFRFFKVDRARLLPSSSFLYVIFCSLVSIHTCTIFARLRQALWNVSVRL